MTRSEAITELYALFGAPHNADINLTRLNKLLDELTEFPPAQQPQRWAVFCQGCRKEWSVSYPHPGKDICVDCDDKLAQQDSTCSNTLRAQGKAYPRTCKKCGLGPCIADRVQPAQQEPDWYHFVRHGDDCFVPYKGQAPANATALYTSPPAQRTWVGLTDEEMREIYKRTDWDMAGGWEYERAIEAKLKEKNNG